jgi:DeoR family transcriptional regulator, suf operon transcriptional repressor
MTPLEISMRQRCLAFLRKNQYATSRELARALNVTPADIRHHLARLRAEGLVDVSENLRSGGRGRPVKVYGLSRLAKGDNLTKLADEVLSEWLRALSPQDAGEALDRVAGRLIGVEKLGTPSPIARRLVQCIELLNTMHYKARWEAHAQGPRMIFETCPYAGVITNHPELCLMDKKLLEKSLGGRVEQVAKLEKGQRNIPVCIFEVIN